MILFAPAKINLGLYITEKRTDGFHNLTTIFYPIPLYDILEMIDSPSFHFSMSGITENITLENNLCIRAIHLLIQEHYLNDLPPVQFHLHKNIPIGAGLGGGSSDAAHTLLMLNDYFNLNITHQQLSQLSEKLGSDCPFFIQKHPCLGFGKGEILEPLNIDLSNYQWILVKPTISISTPWAYQNIVPKKINVDLRHIIQKPIQEWQHILTNDFENIVFKKYPELYNIKQTLYAHGAYYACMSGSGSVLFGIFDKAQKISLPALKKQYQVFVLS